MPLRRFRATNPPILPVSGNVFTSKYFFSRPGGQGGALFRERSELKILIFDDFFMIFRDFFVMMHDKEKMMHDLHHMGSCRKRVSPLWKITTSYKSCLTLRFRIGEMKNCVILFWKIDHRFPTGKVNVLLPTFFGMSAAAVC